MFNIFSHQGNSNKNYNRISSYTSQKTVIKKINVGEDMREKEALHIVGNVNQSNH
jgi:hypothetical protein